MLCPGVGRVRYSWSDDPFDNEVTAQMAAKTDKPISRRPSLLWRMFVLTGMTTAIAVSIDDNAWEAFDDATGGSADRDTIRAITGAAVGLHVFEAILACFMAKRAGLPKPRKWFTSTLLWGSPVLRRLRKARRMELASAS